MKVKIMPSAELTNSLAWEDGPMVGLYKVFFKKILVGRVKEMVAADKGTVVIKESLAWTPELCELHIHL